MCSRFLAAINLVAVVPTERTILKTRASRATGSYVNTNSIIWLAVLVVCWQKRVGPCRSEPDTDANPKSSKWQLPEEKDIKTTSSPFNRTESFASCMVERFLRQRKNRSSFLITQQPTQFNQQEEEEEEEEEKEKEEKAKYSNSSTTTTTRSSAVLVLFFLFRLLEVLFGKVLECLVRLGFWMFSSWSDRNRSASFSSDGSASDSDNNSNSGNKRIPPPVLVYHESARSIVFRDQIRRVHNKRHSSGSITSIDSTNSNGNNNNNGSSRNSFTITTTAAVDVVQQPVIRPLDPLELTANDLFEPMMETIKTEELNPAETHVVHLLQNQQAVVKTVKNCDWTNFLQRLLTAKQTHPHYHEIHDDIPPDDTHPFNSFVTSTSLL